MTNQSCCLCLAFSTYNVKIRQKDRLLQNRTGLEFILALVSSIVFGFHVILGKYSSFQWFLISLHCLVCIKQNWNFFVDFFFFFFYYYADIYIGQSLVLTVWICPLRTDGDPWSQVVMQMTGCLQRLCLWDT